LWSVRVFEDDQLKYCDPFTLSLSSVKALGENCVNDYECESNICVEGQCSSIRGELATQREILEEQVTLLKQIRCFLRSVFGVQDEEECLAEA
jgi:hypothetical protein